VFDAQKPAVFFDDDDLYEDLPDKVSHVPDNEEAKEAPKKLSISSVFHTPKELYMMAAEGEKDAKLKEALVTLYDIGFVDFKINKVLLEKYNCECNTVAEILMNGALNESTMNKVFSDK
jgi:hypothetical protein